MSRPLRFQYAGAVYHVIARGDGGKVLFKDQKDCLLFLKWLSEVCESHGWRVHAWVLMGNHFHLLLETPEANLVSGMRLLLGSFSQAWNRLHQRRGHVFQGRYKSIPVSGERASDGSQLRVVADYIHLNPARAKLSGGKKGPLIDYEWSSLKHYAKGKLPFWMEKDRVLESFELSKDGKGRAAYVRYLEKRAVEQKGRLSEEAMKALQRGWYLGEKSFGEKLLSLASRKTVKSDSAVARCYGESQAEKILKAGQSLFDLDLKKRGEPLKKGDPRKIAIATVIKKTTSVSNQWITEKLQMGHDRAMSRHIKVGQENSKIRRMIRDLNKMLSCEG